MINYTFGVFYILNKSIGSPTMQQSVLNERGRELELLLRE
mgnify:CR=1 FL=1